MNLINYRIDIIAFCIFCFITGFRVSAVIGDRHEGIVNLQCSFNNR